MNKKIVLYLFIGLSIFVMACGDDNVGTTTTIENFESSSLALYKCPLGENNFAIKTTAAHDGTYGLFGLLVTPQVAMPSAANGYTGTMLQS